MSRSAARVLADLREVIAALDRRVPQRERAGETQIAADSACLRQEAETRLAALSAALSGDMPLSDDLN